MVPTAVYDTSSTLPSAVFTSPASVQTDALDPQTGTMSYPVNMALTPSGLMAKTSRSQSLVVSSPRKSCAESRRNVKKSSLLRKRNAVRDSSEVKVVVVEAGASVEVEEEVAGGDAEADRSPARTCTTHPRYFPERLRESTVRLGAKDCDPQLRHGSTSTDCLPRLDTRSGFDGPRLYSPLSNSLPDWHRMLALNSRARECYIEVVETCCEYRAAKRTVSLESSNEHVRTIFMVRIQIADSRSDNDNDK